jgi:hypothetical protein
MGPMIGESPAADVYGVARVHFSGQVGVRRRRASKAVSNCPSSGLPCTPDFPDLRRSAPYRRSAVFRAGADFEGVQGNYPFQSSRPYSGGAILPLFSGALERRRSTARA